MHKGYIVTGLIFGAMIAVLAVSGYSRATTGQHDADWLYEHPQIIYKNGNPEGFCLKCHGKRGENLDNFCNKCHLEKGIKEVDLNKLQKRG